MIEAARFWAIVVLVVAGLFFTFVSAVGVIRLPDIYARAHTASQTDTLGAGLALAAVALALGWQQASVYTVLLLFFVFITNPTAAHAIARSAAETGIEPVTADSAADGDTREPSTASTDRNSSDDDGGSDVDGGETA
ncbi:monovalent cation/H(+) antiporter subunit G [Natrarchaeobius chitinivorans]|uniref:Na+/H+ antiporter subunit G n=1 Tax=Natrarchaeobius chitinivorans TaxID=1679083 RepID=A0A3N6MJB8_NATCH|nr:monovalent cation/H(+) antiporter subunit G [Natrarchaeobius chitinivorans]RQG97170.1 Na+/H+ antiporter subunit G [Natrarchaeobius chitinivorans]